MIICPHIRISVFCVGQFDDATNYLNSHRNLKPAIYKIRRLTEKPRPSLGIHESRISEYYELHAFYFGDYSSDEEDYSDANSSFVSDERSGNNSDSLSEVDMNDNDHFLAMDDNTNNADESAIATNTSIASVEQAENNVSSLIEFDMNGNGDSLTLNEFDMNGNDDSSTLNDSATNSLSNEANEIVNNNVVQSPIESRIQERTDNLDEPFIDQITNENETETEVDPLGNVQAEIKIECVPLYENHALNSSEMDELLDEREVINLSDDDLMMVPESGLPVPFGMTMAEIVKRENDAISGDVAFNIEVSISNIFLNCMNTLLINFVFRFLT